jgi:hypothetical protein
LIDFQRHITPLHAITLFHARCHYDAAIIIFITPPLRHYAIVTPLLMLQIRH